MQASNGSKASRKSSGRDAPVGFRGSRRSGNGPERLVLGMALLLPLAVVFVALAQLPGTSLASPTSVLAADAGSAIMGKRPASSNAAPPPTLVPPTATPRPTATAVPEAPVAPATATPQKGGTYTVQPGDELKHIAATYNVSIWKIIAANNIPNPDGLKIGQELHIPSD
jgi:LysM repeat protein